MARKVEPAPATHAAGDDPAASQLATIAPEVSLEIAGRRITVREYGFLEGLEVAHRAERLIADMHAMCNQGELRYDRIRRLFGVHRGVVVAIAAQAADVEPEWVEALARNDAEAFLSTWFGVNAGFFVHEVVVAMREDRVQASMANPSTGPSSSPGSPVPDSARPPTSSSAPSGS